jgi:hypothetical protein
MRLSVSQSTCARRFMSKTPVTRAVVTNFPDGGIGASTRMPWAPCTIVDRFPPVFPRSSNIGA